MRKENKLVNKIKHLLCKINAPKYLHHFGPKIYELWQHIFSLFIKEYCQLSYRRTTQILRGLGFKIPTKSTLQRYAAKLNRPFWQTVLEKTTGKKTKIGAIDGTGFERTKRSWHYVKRINCSPPKTGYKVSLLSNKRKILNIRIRARPAHDCKDVKYLLCSAKKRPSVLLMDKGYDAEWIHKFCRYDLGIESIIPAKKNCIRGFYRKKMLFSFPKGIYNKRNRIEVTIRALKQKFGASVSSKKINAARTQIYCRAILHNLFLRMIRVLGHYLRLQKIYKV